MKQEQTTRVAPDESGDGDEIEILEVVGLDEDGAVVEDANEVVVTFDEDLPPRRSDPGREARLEERLLQIRADFENLSKRVEREREQYYRHATATLVARLLPVLDNLERALASGRQGGDGIVDGVALIHRQILEELRREGLRPIESLGQAFDPSIHEAVATEPGGSAHANTVVEEMQRGYYFEDRLLRPALVRVSVGASPGGEPSPGSEDS